MKIRFYTFSVFLAMLFGWASFLIVFFRLSPFTTGTLALILFYASLFVALSSTFALLIYYLRAFLSSDLYPHHYLNTALRQGVLLSFMLNIGLAFQRLRVLTWWDALLLLAIAVLIEFYMMARS